MWLYWNPSCDKKIEYIIVTYHRYAAVTLCTSSAGQLRNLFNNEYKRRMVLGVRGALAGPEVFARGEDGGPSYCMKSVPLIPRYIYTAVCALCGWFPTIRFAFLIIITLCRLEHFPAPSTGSGLVRAYALVAKWASRNGHHRHGGAVSTKWPGVVHGGLPRRSYTYCTLWESSNWSWLLAVPGTYHTREKRTMVRLFGQGWPLYRWQWKRDVSIKSLNFKDTLQKISVPLAMSTNLRKKVSNFSKTPKKIIPVPILDEGRPEKNSAKCYNSKRRDSDSSTDIDRQNQRLRHEIWTGRAR